MKPLEMTPIKFDVELRALEIERETKSDYGTVNVEFRFGETTGMQTFTRPELERVGRWFLAAAKRTKALPKPKPKPKKRKSA